ncbi:MAG TPA: DUF5758 domain-containing protein, partial [Saprospiraceae bacterium]|nr:DUF5758 domain-containing protein [Saprospiraceae bacterium]
AKFRCSSAIVVDIEHYDTQEKMNMGVSIYDSSFIYEVGKEVVPHKYCKNLNKVCASGIHYFKTKEAAKAFFFETYLHIYFSDCTILSKVYHTNGSVRREGAYKKGKEEGLIKLWYPNGRLFKEYEFQNGKLNGPYREWYEDGQRKGEYAYINNELDGRYIEWCENGKLAIDCTYKNGIVDGLYRIWDDNGYLKKSNIYKDGYKMD